MKHLIFFLAFSSCLFTSRGQTIARIKKELETSTNPVGYVKFQLKKKFYIDTVSVISTASFMGKADSLAYKGTVGKVYGPFRGENILIKILVKAPNTFYHINHIVLDTSFFSKKFADSLADNIIARIRSGEVTFENMAGTYSSDHSSSNKGGDLGWFVRGVMLPPLDAQLSKHKKGDLFKVWTAAGCHIVRLPDNPKKDIGFALMLRVIL